MGRGTVACPEMHTETLAFTVKCSQEAGVRKYLYHLKLCRAADNENK